MITVKAHALKRSLDPNTVLNDTRFVASDLPKHATSSPEYVGKQSAFMLLRVSDAYGLGDLAAMHRFLQVTADLAAGAFQIWRQEGPVDFKLEGQTIHSEEWEPSYGSGPSDWFQLFSIAVALRRDDTVQVLVDYPEEQLKKSPAGFDKAWFPLINALKSFWLGSKVYATFVADFMQLSEVQNLSVMSPKYAERYRALLPALNAIELGDQKEFTNCLVAGLKAHKAIMGRGSNTKDVTGLLSIPAIGMAALGVRRGMKLEVDSGYCPAWLVNQGTPP